jgi:hypothetical protein
MSSTIRRGVIICLIVAGVALVGQTTPASAQESNPEYMRFAQCLLVALGYQTGPARSSSTPEAVAGYIRFIQAHGLSLQTDGTTVTMLALSEYAERVPESQRRCVLPGTDDPSFKRSKPPVDEAKPLPLYRR